MSIFKTASMIVALTLIGRLLGFFRNVYVSNLYGTSAASDAFYTAVTIPQTLFLVVPGAINAVLIPTMRGLMEKEERTGVLYNKVLTVVFAAFLAMAVLGVVFAREIAWLMGAQENTLEMTADMLRWMWPSAVFIGLAGLWSSVCNAHQHFFTPTLGTVANGALVIVSMYLLVPLYGPDGLAMATTLGYLAAMLTMLPTLRRFGYRHRLSFAWKEDEALRSMGERVVPILIGAVVSQATTFLERGFANGLGAGNVSALANANQIVQMPMAIFVGAFTLPLFPLLASHVKRGEMDQMKQILQKGLAYLLILLLPVTAGLILYAEPIVRLAFQRGEFGELSVALTAWALPFYGLGLYGMAARDLITRAFYALDNTRTPVVVGVIGIAVYAVANWLLIPWMGHGGIALGMAVSVLFQSVLLFALLWRKVGAPINRSFVWTALRTLAACAVMSGGILLADAWLSALPLWCYLLLGVTGGALLYFAALFALREPLVAELVQKLRRRSTPAANR
ncbi:MULTISPECIES: murein biosynthesis integral membrane protein MurJ [Brevibacillus]|jgi:putative peptidoglycan lipid II flippase|uniref:murein biosynthesis integral membrane protein MurJ n=1 Tax=Brevibacillus TaxID=55080 RepID=UPI001492A888|nr:MULTISPECIES: murein biosynthesis integral membrane protein MurJ [Brevibacillus]MDT3414231.1 putative peptidoglycan lipid II flippase [Brevibacillus aydinogluensis]NNV03502.1 murein biosynthesis integral membrane protein MurJ [Brevibacillus sp. MCWH]